MRLEMVIGPMCSGKTDEALRAAARLRAIGKRMLYISPKKDTRHTAIVTHDLGRSEACVKVSALLELLDMPAASEADAIIIDELQFFDDARAFFLQAEERLPDAHFIAACLSGDFERKPWQSTTDVIPLADAITHVKCDTPTPAAFTARTVQDGDKVVIGDTEIYRACCRKHYAAHAHGV